MNKDTLYYATYFDRHYLPRGLVLYQSLRRHSLPFTLFVLCLDGQTHRVLSKLRLDSIVLMKLSDLEKDDPDLAASKVTRRRVEYYWTVGPAFLLWVLTKFSRVKLLTYLDADLFFFKSPAPLFDEIEGKSILITQANLSKVAYKHSIGKARFNVGFTVFRRSKEGMACLKKWRRNCIEWCYQKKEGYKYGDQGYLTKWPELYKELVILRHKGVLGPWNTETYHLSFKGGRVFVDSNPLISYHFSHLRVLTDFLYDSCFWRWGMTMSPLVRERIYIPYVRELKYARELMRKAGYKQSKLDSLHFGASMLSAFKNMILHRSFILALQGQALQS